jgi:single-strand DNA-binding protein
MNVVVLAGVLSAPPVTRDLPSGSIMLTMSVTTDEPSRSSVPVVWFDPPANTSFEQGQRVVVVGSVVRRFFRAGAVTQSRTEVVAAAIDLEGRSRRVRKPLAAVHEQLQSLS